MSIFRENNNQQSVEVQTLHQQPEEVGHNEILEKHQAGFTSHLKRTQKEGQICINQHPKYRDVK